jgi:hypothetical protein
MGKIKILLVAFIIIIFLTSTFRAWSFIPNYANSQNVTVNDWNYTSILDSITYKQSNAQYVLIKLNFSLSFSEKVKGYDQNLNFLGNITWSPVPASNGTFILIPRLTDNGQAWSMATIFYHNIGGYSGVDPFNLSRVKGLNAFTINGLPILWNKTLDLSKSNNQTWVIISSMSLANVPFNITYWPDIVHKLMVYSINGRYYLKSFGLVGNGTYLTESPKTSSNANLLYGDPYGFEGYFAHMIPNNDLLSEGLIFNQSAGIVGKLYNTTSNSLANAGYNTTSAKLKLHVYSSNDIYFTFMPAFTTNYIIQGQAQNPTPTVSPAQNGTYFDYKYRIPITNINWTTAFTTNAWYGYYGTIETNTIKIPNVPYLLLNITHYYEMGNNCQYVYLRSLDTSVNPNIDYGAIPFYVYNCTTNGNDPMQLLISNHTEWGYLFNKFYLYYASPNNVSGDLTPFSNISVYNDFILNKGTNFNLTTGNNFLKLTYPLNSNSYLVINNSYGHSPDLWPYFNNDGKEYLFYGSSCCGTGGNSELYTFIPSRLFLHMGSDMITQTLNSRIVSGQAIFSNTSTFYGVATSYPDDWVISLISSPNIATQTKLYSNNAIIGSPQLISTIVNGTTGLPNTLPNSTTSGGLVTTTINPSAIISPTQTISFTGYTIPVLLARIISTILIFLGAILVNRKGQQNVNGFILMLVIIWLIGLWNIAILVLGIIITLVFIIYEFQMKK